jgi:hypothetical protein
MVNVTNKSYNMHSALKSNIDHIIYNISQDWDFLIIISGDGMTRVGKSVLAQQIAYYVAYNLNRSFDENNIIFSGEELIKKGNEFPKNSVFVYDEARADLDNKKQMFGYVQNLLDFFSECGMYNHFIILVLPEFFELPKSIALNRSEFLINVKRQISKVDGQNILKFERGFFDFYNRTGKRKLYWEGRRNYFFYNEKFKVFDGYFPNFWVLDKDKYEVRKRAYLQRERNKPKEKKEQKKPDDLVSQLDKLNFRHRKQK